MTKVLIVDDELLVRIGLANSVDWAQFDCELIGELSSGKEALSFILNRKPDLIFLDITMPDMSGLELMQKLQELKIYPQIIILSCHDEFEYVKTAMKLGASEYILKLSFRPADIETLLKKKTHGNNSGITELTAVQVKEVEYEQFFAVAICNVDDIQAFRMKQALVYDIASRMGSKEVKVICDIENDVLSILFGSMESTRMDATTSMNFAQRLRNAIELITNGRLLCGLSHVITGKDARLKTKQEAKKSMEQAFYDYRKISLYKEYLNPLQFFKQYNIYPLEIAILSGKEEDINSYFQKVKEAIGISPNQFKAYLVSHMGVLSQRGIDVEPLLKRIEEAKTLNDIEDALEKLVKESKQSKSANRYIVQAIEKVNHSYSDSELSLESLAKNLNLNPSYLSKLFKNETGRNFVEFLNATRIEAAIRFISSGEYTVSDAAAETGFQNIHYFSKVFKKVTGYNPSEIKYKNKNNINDLP